MVFRRRKNNKARNILKKIRGRKRITTKKFIKSVAERVVKKKLEKKIFLVQPTIVALTNTGTSYTVQRQLGTILPNWPISAVAVGDRPTGYTERFGLKITDVWCNMKIRIIFPTQPTVPLYFRFIIFKPKLQQDDLQSEVYLNNLFNGTGSQNFWDVLDPSQGVWLKDKIVVFNPLQTRNVITFTHTLRQKTCMYSSNAAATPEDRNLKWYLAYAIPNAYSNIDCYRTHKLLCYDT